MISVMYRCPSTGLCVDRSEEVVTRLTITVSSGSLRFSSMGRSDAHLRRTPSGRPGSLIERVLMQAEDDQFHWFDAYRAQLYAEWLLQA
jgi:hypothetical protein